MDIIIFAFKQYCNKLRDRFEAESSIQSPASSEFFLITSEREIWSRMFFCFLYDSRKLAYFKALNIEISLQIFLHIGFCRQQCMLNNYEQRSLLQS